MIANDHVLLRTVGEMTVIFRGKMLIAICI